VARGGPDWSNPDYQLSGIQVDIADVADRLLGFARLDTRGRIVYLDRFENGLTGWQTLTAGAGVAPVVKSQEQYAWSGATHVYFDAGAAVDGESQIVRSTWLGQTKRIGMEVGLYIDNTVASIRLVQFYRRVGQAGAYIQMRYERSSAQWILSTSGGDYVVVAQAAPAAGRGYFVPVKMAADFLNVTGLRFLLGETQYNLDDQALGSVAGIDEGEAYSYITVRSAGGGNQYGRVGYVIFTKDEP